MGFFGEQPVRGFGMTLRDRVQLSPEDEQRFRAWMKKHAGWVDINSPYNLYDYREAYKRGEGPDKTGHWPSTSKTWYSPERYLIGESGRIYDSFIEDPEEPYRYLMDED